MPSTLADRIDAILPQTQCTRCGYQGCRPYAEALAAGEAAINRCPPGGRTSIERLARLLDTAPLALDPECGSEGPHLKAVIDEAVCIGCTKCIVACPVDAIIGAPKRMHTVAESLCSGCELCVPACPVDCIAMRPNEAHPLWTESDSDAARSRTNARRERLERERADEERRLAHSGIDRPALAAGETRETAAGTRREVIEAAMRKARARMRERADAGGRTGAQAHETARAPGTSDAEPRR